MREFVLFVKSMSATCKATPGTAGAKFERTMRLSERLDKWDSGDVSLTMPAIEGFGVGDSVTMKIELAETAATLERRSEVLAVVAEAGADTDEEEDNA